MVITSHMENTTFHDNEQILQPSTVRNTSPPLPSSPSKASVSNTSQKTLGTRLMKYHPLSNMLDEEFLIRGNDI